MEPEGDRPKAERRSWLTRGVVSVGLASFSSDSRHEIATSVLPTFVTVTLRSSAGALGVIEGISDALTGVAKLRAGPLSLAPPQAYGRAFGLERARDNLGAVVARCSRPVSWHRWGSGTPVPIRDPRCFCSDCDHCRRGGGTSTLRAQCAARRTAWRQRRHATWQRRGSDARDSPSAGIF